MWYFLQRVLLCTTGVCTTVYNWSTRPIIRQLSSGMFKDFLEIQNLKNRLNSQFFA